jgi:hypothetical protein
MFRWAVAKVPPVDALLKTRPGTVLRWGCTMYLVLLGWLIFRINNPADPFDFTNLAYCLKKFVVFDFNFGLSALGLGKSSPFLAAMLVGSFLLLHAASRFKGRIHDQLDRAPRALLPLIYALLAAIFYFFWPSTNAAFIYFQF